MDKKIVTYSLLAYINDQSKSQATFESIFVPVVKRALSKMCSEGQFKGDDINDIKRHINELFEIDMPNTILKKILGKIAREINEKENANLIFYSEGSFVIDKYLFTEYDEEINRRSDDLDRLQSFYLQFLTAEGVEDNKQTIYDFVEQNKFSIGKYIHKKYPGNSYDNTYAARFVNFISPIKELYDVLQSVYIGSIISSYLEYQPSEIKKDVELVLDTNFIISLLDLNTSNSTDNCRRLLEIAQKLGYKFIVLGITLKEIDQLLKVRVDYFDTAFLSKQLDTEDIYNACERRNLTKTDLDFIRHNVEKEIEKFNVSIVSNTEKFENKAKFSEDYEKLKEKRNTSFAALHDATCIEYVKERRGKPIYEFGKVNCWFVNNSSSRNAYYTNGSQPFLIKAEDLLNLLWLASPMVKGIISNNEISKIGISRLVAATLDDALPNAVTVRKLDDNLQKYAKGQISDADVVRVAKGIASNTIGNLESLNDIANSDSKKFVETLQNIANVQRKKEDEYKELLDRLTKDLKNKVKIFHEKTNTIDEQIALSQSQVKKEQEKYQEVTEVNNELSDELKRYKKENVDLQNKIRKPLRDKYIYNRIFWWRFKSFVYVLLGPIVLISIVGYILYLNNGSIKLTKEFLDTYKENVIASATIALASIIYSGLFVKVFADKYNQSTINAFKSNIDIPENLQELRK